MNRTFVRGITCRPAAACSPDATRSPEAQVHAFFCSTSTWLPLADDALAALLDYRFPGNVRELENIIERAFILCRGSQVAVADLPRNVRAAAQDLRPPEETTRLEQVEAESIEQALIEHQGNRTKTAVALGIHRTTLIRKLKQYGLS